MPLNKRHSTPLLLSVKVVPGSSRDQIVGWLGEALKVKVAAPPEKGKANTAVERLIASSLGMEHSCVNVVRGHSNASKVLSISSLTEAELAARLTTLTQKH